jgi:hypothetical protein
MHCFAIRLLNASIFASCRVTLLQLNRPGGAAHEAARVHHAARQRGGRMAARGARTAARTHAARRRPQVRRKLADQFYRRFFELAPVGTLDKREMFQSIISHSGRQHAQFGAKPLHFAAFGDALIWGLEQQFGAAFTLEMKEAWIELYDDVQREMMRAGGTLKEADSEQFRSAQGPAVPSVIR